MACSEIRFPGAATVHLMITIPATQVALTRFQGEVRGYQSGRNLLLPHPPSPGKAGALFALCQTRLEKVVPELLRGGDRFWPPDHALEPENEAGLFSKKRNAICIARRLSGAVMRLQLAIDFLRNVAQRGGRTLFVGGRKQAQEAVKGGGGGLRPILPSANAGSAAPDEPRHDPEKHQPFELHQKEIKGSSLDPPQKMGKQELADVESLLRAAKLRRSAKRNSPNVVTPRSVFDHRDDAIQGTVARKRAASALLQAPRRDRRCERRSRDHRLPDSQERRCSPRRYRR